MRLTVSEKQEIIHMVTRSEIGVNRTLREIGINKSTFYNWYHAYSENGVEGLIPTQRTSKRQWNSIPQEQKNLVVKLALDYPDLSSRELAYKITDEQQIFISESSVYRILKSRGLTLGIDTPYSGSIVPMEYYQKDKRVTSIMLEVNRRMYLNEPTNDKSEGYQRTKNIIQEYTKLLKSL